MKLGEHIFELRKEKNLSQEQLAEIIDVTRQTISNWELGETSPNPEQLKVLSKAFNVSVDDLLENDIRGVLTEKITNTEKLAGMIIKILKFIGIVFIGLLVIDVIAFCLFIFVRKQPPSSELKSATLNCSIEDKNYEITFGSDGYFNCSNCDEKMQVYLTDITDWANIENGVKNVKTYFTNNGGSCKE